jgi:hypothetical protein
MDELMHKIKKEAKLIKKAKDLATKGLDLQLKELAENIKESCEVRFLVEALLNEENDELTTLFYQLSGIDIPTPCFNPYHLSPNWVYYLNGFILWYRKGEVNFEFEKTHIGAYRVKKTDEGRSNLYDLIKMAEWNREVYSYDNSWRRMFNIKGIIYSQKYLAGHFDFRIKENVRAVFKAAGYDVTDEDFIEFQKNMPFTFI